MKNNTEEVEVAILKTQMEVINKRFDKLESTIDIQFKRVFEKFDEMDNKYVSNERFRIYQVVLGLVGSTVTLYMVNMMLNTIFHK